MRTQHERNTNTKDKPKKPTNKSGRIVVEETEIEEITFEEFEQTMVKIVRSEGIKEKSKDKRKSQ